MIRNFKLNFVYRLLLIFGAVYGVYQAGAVSEATAHLNPDVGTTPATAADVVENDRGANFLRQTPYTTTLTFTPVMTAYLSNPAVGWQEGRTPDNPILPETVVYRRKTYNWRDQNPEEGVFDWSAVDADLEAAVAQGKQFSFRIYTMRGEKFDTHQLPFWVPDKGAEFWEGGEPIYKNCVYQEEWGKFVEALRQKYDGNPDIAFIDISGYGNFNEWSWNNQTEWEDDTKDDKDQLDVYARRRLADMFIGGQRSDHKCETISDDIKTISYDYPGFQKTQLLMPYASIKQSSKYVASRRSDVGIRHDCLGASSADGMRDHIGEVVSKTWLNAPIIYEFCSGSTSDPNYIERARDILRWTHGSMVHDNLNGNRDVDILTDILKFAGYRFTLKQVAYPTTIAPDHDFTLSMIWHNTGYAPTYPKMGQDFELHFYLVAAGGTVARDWPLEADIATWMPADPVSADPPDNHVAQTLKTPADLPTGRYTTMVAIIDKRTGQPINLAFKGQDVDVESRDNQGRYRLGQITVSETPTPNNEMKVFLPLIVNDLPDK